MERDLSLGRRDRGAITTFVTIFTTAVIFMFGLVYDGGRLLAAQRQADNEAAAAARAAAQAIDEAALRASPPGAPVYVLDEGQAAANVCAYFNELDYSCGDVDYDVVFDGDNRVTVRLRLTVAYRVIPGGNRTVEGEGTACNELGLTSENRIVVCDP